MRIASLVLALVASGCCYMPRPAQMSTSHYQTERVDVILGLGFPGLHVCTERVTVVWDAWADDVTVFDSTGAHELVRFWASDKIETRWRHQAFPESGACLGLPIVWSGHEYLTGRPHCAAVYFEVKGYGTFCETTGEGQDCPVCREEPPRLTVDREVSREQ